MKKSNCSYAKVSVKNVSTLVSSIDPLNSSRLPIGIPLTCQPDLREIPASGSITKPWQAIMLVDASDEAYFVSPRVFLGLAFVGQKFTKVIEQPFPKVSLLDYLKDSPVVKVVNYDEVDVDDFNDKSVTVSKAMPKFSIEAIAPKAKKVKNN